MILGFGDITKNFFEIRSIIHTPKSDDIKKRGIFSYNPNKEYPKNFTHGAFQ